MDPWNEEGAGGNPAFGGEPSSQREGDAEGREDQDAGGEGEGHEDGRDPDAAGSGGGSDAGDADEDAAQEGEDGDEGRDARGGEEDGEEEGEGDDEDGQRLSKRQRARQRKKAKIREKDEYIEQLEAENKAIRDKLDRTSKTGEELKRPNPDDYEHGDNDPEYVADLSVYKLKKSDMEKNTEELESQSKATAEKISKAREENWAQAQAEGRSRYADYDEVVNRLSQDDVTPEMAATIVDSDDPAGLAYALGKSPDLARKISRMSPLQQARALGGIEARLSARTRGRKPADPPDPIRTVSGKSARGQVRTPYNARSEDEYFALRRQQEQRRMEKSGARR